LLLLTTIGEEQPPWAWYYALKGELQSARLLAEVRQANATPPMLSWQS
jgi:hypothetical protein